MKRTTLAVNVSLAFALIAWAPLSYAPPCLSFCTTTISLPGAAPTTASGQLNLTFPASTDFNSPILGERVLLDNDGDLTTTADQFSVTRAPVRTVVVPLPGGAPILDFASVVLETREFEENVAARRADGGGVLPSAPGTARTPETQPIDLSKVQVPVQRFSATQGAAGAEETRQITESRQKLAADIRDRAAKRGATEAQIAAELAAANLESVDKGAPQTDSGREPSILDSIVSDPRDVSFGKPPVPVGAPPAAVSKPPAAAEAPDPAKEKFQEKAAQDIVAGLFSGNPDKSKAAASALGNAPKDLQNRVVRGISEKIQGIVNDALRAATAAAAGAPRPN